MYRNDKKFDMNNNYQANNKYHFSFSDNSDENVLKNTISENNVPE